LTSYRRLLQETLPRVRETIDRAAARSGRRPEDVRIVAVTKGHPLPAVQAALGAGLRELGENRLDELEEKASAVDAGDVRWHMIGHLQRRTAPRVRGLASLVHSLDSLRLAERLERSATPGEKVLPVLVQVNVTGEESKSGFSTDEVVDALGELLQFESLRIQGMMTMAPFTPDEGILRGAFRGLRELHEAVGGQVPEYRGKELSMGMSNDFGLAVEEGSTIVRIGSGLFGERPA
jgi:pyridoxal phosphate enzyme (YggS family)